MELLRWVFARIIGNIKIKYFLICISSVEFSVAITFKACANQVNAQTVLDYSYCTFDHHSFRKGENLSLSFCYTPQSDFQNISILISNRLVSNFVVPPRNIKGKYLNTFVFTSHKFRIGEENNYLFEIKFGNDKIHSTQLPLWQLKKQQTEIRFYGLVAISINFFSYADHSTNCESELSSKAFLGCSVEIASKNSFTSCFFDEFYPEKIGGTRSLKFCFQPEPSLSYLSAALVNDDKSLRYSLSTSGPEHFKLNEGNEVILNLSKTSHRFFRIITFQNSLFKLAQSDVQFSKKLELNLIGDWKGSRKFISVNDRDFTNCFDEQQFLSSKSTTDVITLTEETTKSTTEVITLTEETTKSTTEVITLTEETTKSTTEVITLTEETTNSIEDEMTTESDGDGQSELTVCSFGLHYIVAIAVVSLLTIGLAFALVVVILHYQKKIKATAGATTNEITNQELNEDAQRNENKNVVNEPYNINVMAAEILQEEEVKYTSVSFKTSTKKKGKPKKTPKKPPRVLKTPEIKPLNEKTVKTVYSTILPEVQIENEEVQYMNVGEHAMINCPVTDHDVVLYANVND